MSETVGTARQLINHSYVYKISANQKPTLPRYSEDIRAHLEYKSHLIVNRESFVELFDFDQ